MRERVDSGVRIHMIGLLACCLLVCAPSASADTADDGAVVETINDAAADTTESSRTLFLPILGYSPDTSVMLGVSAMRFFQLEPGAEKSVFSPVLIYTFKKQTIFFLGSSLYWGRQRANIVPGYEKFPDQFYGIGRDSRTADEEDYTPEKIELDVNWEYEIHDHVYLGLNYHLLFHRITEMEEGGQLASGDIEGVEKSTLSGPGLQANLDTRENIWSPRRGVWLQGLARFYRSAWGSDFQYTRYEIDLRAFLPVGEKSVLAFQVLGTSHDGDTPFFTLPRLGGFSGLRGYRQGRYMDNTRALARVEWRSGDILGRFGVVGFAGIGDVASRPGLLSLEAELWTVGGGVRYTLVPEEQVKLRLDMGFGNGDSGFYLSFGEAF